MSDERANQPIAMVTPRAVDVSRWLLVRSSDWRGAGVVSAILRQFGEVSLCSEITPKVCGAIFVSEVNQTIRKEAGRLLQYFFTRDRAEARVFEFDKFTNHFVSRRLDEILSRTV